MKKTIIAAVMLLAGITSAKADNDRPINLDQLPKASQEVLAEHFSGLQLAFAVEDRKYIGSEYEVVYTDRTEVEFNTEGEWTSVERRYDAVPAGIVPAEISKYLDTLEFARGQQIRKISHNRFEWEVELSNGLEIEFDTRFNVIGIDD